MENDKRIYKWDNGKLFFIFLVIFGHILDREGFCCKVLNLLSNKVE